MSGAEQFQAEATARLEGFYRRLAEYGEAPPASRYRLEGFLEAGLALGLVEEAWLRGRITEAQRRYLDRALPAPPDAAPWAVAVRWARAPVYPGGGA